jgi:phage terminase large subunit-like protein
MSKRKSIDKAQGHLSKVEKERRKVQELDIVRPQGLDRNLRNWWAKAIEEFGHVLTGEDATALLAYCEARAAKDKVAAEIVAAEFRGRAGYQRLEVRPTAEAQAAPDNAPVPPVEAPVHTLAAFLADAEATRASFAQRRIDDVTVTLDTTGQPYTWPADDFAARARAYALAGKDDTAHMGEWMRKACARFLSDLETGASRGLWFDPAAGRAICEFAERYCGIRLMEWQVFALCNIYGWKRVLGQRRFTESLISTGKKNGKTRLAAVIALWGLLADGEKHPDCFSVATKKDQARIVFRDAKRAVGDHPELAAHIKRWSGSLMIGNDEGEFVPLASEENSLDGLRPSTIVMDEVAFWDDRLTFDKLAKGVVSRPQPLIFEITTAGNKPRCFAQQKFDIGEKILNGIIADDTTFVAIFSVDRDDDHLHNEECWYKSNPSLGVTLQAEHLRKTRDEVLVDATGLPAWVQYHCNRWAERDLAEQGTISIARWEELARLDLIGAKDPMDAYAKFVPCNKGKHVWVGLDLGKVNDMTAIVVLWRNGYLKPHVRNAIGNVTTWADEVDMRFLLVGYFMPEQGIDEKAKHWGVPLHTWIKEGWIKTFPGDMIDDLDVEKELRLLAQNLTVYSLGFDKWQAETICGRLHSEKVVECFAVPQIPSVLTTPSREFKNDIKRGTVVHFGNPVLRWNIENVVLAEDDHGGIKPRKVNGDDNRKIDGVSATINAYSRMLAAPASINPKVFSI